MQRIAVLMACHNRKEKTLCSISGLLSNNLPKEISLKIILVDDGSTDGTSNAVSHRFPSVRIIKGNGKLFWNGGMRLAYADALSQNYDGYLFLNDDAFLYPDAVFNLILTWRSITKSNLKDVIIVGSLKSPSTGIVTYGGRTRLKWFRPLAFSLVSPDVVPVPCETMNGNCVLIPKSIAVELGNLDSHFVHAMGDLDYGLRASALGYDIWVAPGFLGECEVNTTYQSALCSCPSAIGRIKILSSPKFLPFLSWWIFAYRHGRLLAPILWVWPYLRTFLFFKKS